MKKITQIILLFLYVLGFSQEENSEFKNLVNAEMKSASNTLSVKVNPNTQNYDVTYQELRFTANPELASGKLSGVVKTTFTALANMNTIVFDMASQLKVSSVIMNNNSLTFFQSNYELNIIFPFSILAGTSNSVIITYSGIPPTNQGAYTRSTHSEVPIIYTLSEPYGARDWWPCKQDLNDKINSLDVYITAPEKYNSVSNGVQISRIISNGNATTHFKHNYPIPAYLIVLNVTNYQIIKQLGGLGTLASPYFLIVNYLYPETILNGTQDLNTTPDIMNFFESILEPYPFRNEKYGHAQFGWGGGMEHTTVSSMGSFGRNLIAHEMAHQWFGNKITCGTWKDIWLNEGLTEYMSGLVYEKFDDASTFVAWKTNKINSITSSTSGYVYLQDADLTNINRIFSNRLTYNKGAMVTHMLRWKMGNIAFFNALKSYLADPALAYGYAVTANFKTHLEVANGNNSLTEFFNDWLFNEGYPTYNVTVQNWGYGQVKITINQTQSHPSVTFFEMPLEIRLTNGTLINDVRIENTSNAQEFIVECPFSVTGVEFDPNKHIISKNNTVSFGNDTFEFSESIALYPVPASDELTIQIPTNLKLNRVEIFNTIGQLIKIENSKKFSVSQLASGLHFLKIHTSEGVFHKNFTKK